MEALETLFKELLLITGIVVLLYIIIACVSSLIKVYKQEKAKKELFDLFTEELRKETTRIITDKKDTK